MRTNELTQLLPLLLTFVRVVEAGSFAAAARQVGQTPSALSRQIARLEQALALRLLERTTRRLRPTAAGEEVYAKARDLLAAGEAVLTLGEDLAGTPRGLLHLSTPKAFGRFVINPLVPAFLARYPQLDLHLELNDRPADLIADGFDLRIQVTDTPPPALVGRPLMQVRQLLCASPAYLARAGLPRHPEELRRHSCLYLAEQAHDNHWHFARDSEQAMVEVRGRYASNHSEARLAMAEAGLGITCLPQFTAAAALAAGTVVEVLADWRYGGAYQGTAWLLWRPGRQVPPRMRVLIDYLVECLAGR